MANAVTCADIEPDQVAERPGPGSARSKSITASWLRLPGEQHDDNVLLTAGMEVPAGSQIARMARRVSADPDRTQTAGTMLRANIANAPARPAATARR